MFLIYNEVSLEIRSQGLVWWLRCHQRPTFLPVLASQNVAVFIMIPRCLLYINAMTIFLANGEIQRTRSEQVTPAVFLLQEAFPTTSSINLYFYILVPTGRPPGLPWPRGAWKGGITWSPCLPKQKMFLLVQKKGKMDIGKQLTESSKRATIRWGPAVC